MKRLLFTMFALVAALPAAMGGPRYLWSGRWCELPGSGKWQIVAKHGRLLARGNGAIKFQLPPLKGGTTLNAELKTENSVEKLLFISPAPLSGITAAESDLPPAQLKLLKNYGVAFTGKPDADVLFSTSAVPAFPGKLQLVFTHKNDFPITFEKTVKTICNCDVRTPGSLGINFTKQEKIIDNNGDYNYIQLEKAPHKLVIFSPDFDLKNIENIILLKYIIDVEINYSKSKGEIK